MSRARLRVDQLAYHGPDKPAARLTLKAGLNVICGSSDTGKSFVIDTIDFMLGSSTELRQLPERAGYDRVVMHASLTDGKTFTVQRSTEGGAYLWRAGHHDELTKEGDVLKPSHSSEREDNLSRRLLVLLGLDACRLRRDRDFATVSLSLRHLVLLSLVNETRIFETISPVLTQNKVNNTIEKSAFKFFLTGVDDSALVAIREARDSHARSRSSRDALATLVEQRQSKLPTADEIDRRRRQLAQLQQQMADIGQDVAEDERRHKDTVNRSRVLDRFVYVARRRQTEVDGLLQRFALLDEHYESDLGRLEAIRESGAIFQALHPGPCPFCGALPEAQTHLRECEVDPESIIVAAGAEIDRITLLRSGLVETREQLSAEGGQLRERTDRAITDYESAFRHASNLNSVLREKRRGVGDLDREARELRKQLLDADIVASLRTDLEATDQVLAEAEAQISAVPGATIPTAETVSFAQEIEAVLSAWDFPGEHAGARVAWDAPRTDVIIGNRRRSDQGKGLRAITCAAFLLTLMKRCLEKANPHLGLLALDSPLLAYWKPEGQADDLRGTQVDDCFYRWTIARLPADCQVIIIENRPLPKWLPDQSHVVQFTKNKKVGRYGLFPLVD